MVSPRSAGQQAWNAGVKDARTVRRGLKATPARNDVGCGDACPPLLYRSVYSLNK